MALVELTKRTLLSLLDPVIFLMALLFGFLMSLLMDAMGEILLIFMEEYLVTLSFWRAMGTALASMSVTHWLIILVEMILMLYIGGVAIWRIYSKRKGVKLNPFLKAWSSLPHLFLSTLFVTIFPAIILLLGVYLGGVWFFLAYILALIWVSFTLPVIYTTVTYQGAGRDRIYEGLLAGSYTWWKVLLILLILEGIIVMIPYSVGFASVLPFVISAEASLIFEGE